MINAWPDKNSKSLEIFVLIEISDISIKSKYHINYREQT